MKNDFAYVAGYQEKLAEAGWRWDEHTFQNGDVVLRFTRSPEPLAFLLGSNPNYSEDCRYGWGRFQRATAWHDAHAFLVLELTRNDSDLARLREYKAVHPPLSIQL
jgi:hypothetical protein